MIDDLITIKTNNEFDYDDAEHHFDNMVDAIGNINRHLGR